MQNIIERVRSATLSKNAERHIRKHFKEFGFQSASTFTRERIIETAHRVSNNATQIFYHSSRYGDSIVFFDGTHLLIVDAKKNAVKTMFVVEDKDYIRRKIQRKIWNEIQEKEKRT